jgi:hypothetical protein
MNSYNVTKNLKYLKINIFIKMDSESESEPDYESIEHRIEQEFAKLVLGSQLTVRSMFIILDIFEFQLSIADGEAMYRNASRTGYNDTELFATINYYITNPNRISNATVVMLYELSPGPLNYEELMCNTSDASQYKIEGHHDFEHTWGRIFTEHDNNILSQTGLYDVNQSVTPDLSKLEDDSEPLYLTIEYDFIQFFTLGG